MIPRVGIKTIRNGLKRRDMRVGISAQSAYVSGVALISICRARFRSATCIPFPLSPPSVAGQGHGNCVSEYVTHVDHGYIDLPALEIRAMQVSSGYDEVSQDVTVDAVPHAKGLRRVASLNPANPRIWSASRRSEGRRK